MNKPYHNDQASIADSFYYLDDHTNQTARLAFFKISSYKLSLVYASFGMSRQELSDSIQSSLFNYRSSSDILCDLGFFETEADN